MKERVAENHIASKQASKQASIGFYTLFDFQYSIKSYEIS